jgi:hypothetical protein
MKKNINYDLYDGLIQLRYVKKAMLHALEGIEAATNQTILDVEADLSFASDDFPKEVSTIGVAIVARQHLKSTLYVQLYSSLLSAYAIFEHTLLVLSENYLKASESVLSVGDFSGSGIEKSKTIISKVGGVGKVFSGESWEKIIRVRTIRNKLAHTFGEVSAADLSSKEKSVFTDTAGVKLEATGVEDRAKIVLHQDFVISVMNLFDDFLEVTNGKLEEQLNAHA